ncbi:hypothetical protein GCM10028803_22610 [Larkinella knui]|uniref:Uncharacterized protein n=1 Tax=Larkinella knui TaxID=2025310 RepID=A0A3P1CVJ4_9BACT|nr:hypothetical protein [Larkinella knui]RRB17335.1 hypothetical protein EHT87_03355 [Larkinella knui]
MKEENDDELQAWLDEQNRLGQKPLSPETDEKLRLYQQIFDELSTEPPVGLSYGFSAAVVRQIQKSDVVRRERRAYAVLGFCLLLMPLAALAMQAVFRNPDLMETFRALDVVKFPALFILLLLVLIQWADRRFVKRKLNP